MKKLTIDTLIEEAGRFCEDESKIKNTALYGVTDGKAVGTYVEHKFLSNLQSKYLFEKGNSAEGIDIPDLNINTDIKVTSIKQPQSTCPFKNAEQKIFGLGYNLLVFVYDKNDYSEGNFASLDFRSCSYISKTRTSDYTTTKRLIEMIKDKASIEDIYSYLSDRNIPADEIGLTRLSEKILKEPPILGFLTISNALQWRLQYQRVVSLNEEIEGIIKII